MRCEKCAFCAGLCRSMQSKDAEKCAFCAGLDGEVQDGMGWDGMGEGGSRMGWLVGFATLGSSMPSHQPLTFVWPLFRISTLPLLPSSFPVVTVVSTLTQSRMLPRPRWRLSGGMTPWSQLPTDPSSPTNPAGNVMHRF